MIERITVYLGITTGLTVIRLECSKCAMLVKMSIPLTSDNETVVKRTENDGLRAVCIRPFRDYVLNEELEDEERKEKMGRYHRKENQHSLRSCHRGTQSLSKGQDVFREQTSGAIPVRLLRKGDAEIHMQSRNQRMDTATL